MNFKIFKNRNFSLFVFGQGTSILGTGFLTVALSLYVLDITGSAKVFASILALGMLPQIIIGPFVGTIVDKVYRKTMIVVLDFVRGIFAVFLFAFSIMNQIDMWMIYVIVIFFAICQTFFGPAFTTILPSIVKKEELVDANSIQRTLYETVSVAAPFLGALIFGIYGIGIIFLIDGITFLISAISESFMEVPSLELCRDKSPFLKEVIDGFKVIFTNNRITSLVINGTLTHLFLIPFVMVGFPFIIIIVLGGKDADYGIVESIATIGSVLSIFAIGYAKKRFNVAECIGIGIIGMLIFTISMLPLTSDELLNLIFNNSLLIVSIFSIMIFILYLSFGFYGVFYVTFYQTIIPQEKLGRYVAIQGLLFSLGRLLGLNVYGYIFDNFDLIVPIIILAIGMILKLVVHIPFLRETKKLEVNNQLVIN